jgi:hypothetical protein
MIANSQKDLIFFKIDPITTPIMSDIEERLKKIETDQKNLDDEKNRLLDAVQSRSVIYENFSYN